MEYFDVTTEFIGLGKEYTTQLTKEEIQDLDVLFNSIGESLNKSVSLEESIGIFKESVIELDSFGLLGDVGIDETVKLVTSSYKRTILMKTLERLYNRKKGTLGEDENWFCLIVGKTTGFVFLSPIVVILVILFVKYLIEQGYFDDPEDEIMLMALMLIMLVIPSVFIPFCLGRIIGFEDWARGTVISFGLNGLKYWNGNLKGKLGLIGIEDIGMLGFTGLKIEVFTAPNQYLLGFAPLVHIEHS